MFSLISLALLGLWCGFTADELENNIVRLHVIANSDSEADQSLKLQVRDRITDLARKQGSTPELLQLEKMANEVLFEEDAPYKAEVTYSKYYVNRRRYESFILPEGKYTAACVKLGRGEGKNWWCVLSPPLCFTNSSLGDTEEMDMYIDNETSTVINGITVKLKVFETASRLVSFIKNNK